MLQNVSKRLFTIALFLAVLILWGLFTQTMAGESAPAPNTAAKKEKSYHRLPRFYSSVVTVEQRKTIYQIQDDYGPRIDALKRQLEKLQRERDEKIADILTAEQQKAVAAATTLAQEKKAAKKAENMKKQDAADAPKKSKK